MRTRKHQSPVESNWVDKHKQCEETPRAGNEGQPGLAAPTTTATEQGAASESPQRDPSENSANADHKKANGKKQKRRKKSPRNKSQLPKVDCMLAGLMADNVWLEKRVYEEAERAHHAALAADLARAIATKPSVPEANAHGAAEGTVTNCGGLPQRSCNHSSATACHHVDNSIWVNKFTFDDAEGQFVSRFTSPLAPRALGLPLASPTRPAQRISDEGYVSATPTPATQELRVIGSAVAPAAPTGTTVNGKPHWAGLQDTMAEVWLEKPSYDRAERNFYESLASQQSLQKTEPSNHWSFHSGKKGKKDKASRKSAGKAQPAGPKRERPRIPEEGIGRLNCPVYYFLHQDSENVWLNKPAYDKAEETFYEIQALKPQPATKKPTAAKTRKPAKCKGHAAPRSAKKMAAPFLSTEKVWLDKYKFDDAERQYYEHLSKRPAPEASNQQKEDGASTILRDIARARENIQKSLAGLRTVLHSPKEAPPSLPQSQSGPLTSAAASQTSGGESGELLSRVANLEQENQNLHKVVKDLQLAISKLESRLATLEKSAASAPAACTPAAPVQNAKAAPEAPAPKQEEEDDDDDIDLFGSDEEEDAEAARIKEERLRQYAEKKSKKPGLIAKSSILLDVKPWDDETDMAKLEECVRSVQMEGLLWGSSKLVPVGYGIKKLQIQCVVEDDKVGTDILEEEITKFENYVQSVDIAAFNKI